VNDPQYRVVADKDSTPDLVSANAAPGDRLVYEVIDADRWSLVRIERPVPATDEPKQGVNTDHLRDMADLLDGLLNRATLRQAADQLDRLRASAPQPPTREQVTTAVRPVISRWYDTGGNLQERIADAVLALFPQPTPVDPDDEFVAPYEMQERGVREQPTPSGAPLGVIRMAAGTVFTACTIEDDRQRRMMRTTKSDSVTDHAVVDETGERWHAWYVDPSTIRDVTPPPTTPEEDR
jgi:hypothetical protein